VLRNPGARVDDDVRGALALAHDALGVERVIVIGHTGCLGVPAEELDAAVTEAVDAIDGLEAGGTAIDILVNNAGIQRRRALEDFDHDDWRDIMATNVDGVFYVGQAVARHMIARGRGKIIHIGSVQSELVRATTTPYATSKGAVRNLTRGMCAEWAKFELQINAIGPGYFQTPLNQVLADDPAFDAWLKKRTPAGRWGRLEDLHGAAVFLASSASDFVNGQMLHVDGGVTAVI
jgi:gluconate 5-dehydrogenase